MTALEDLEDLESHLGQEGQVNPADLRHKESDKCKFMYGQSKMN